MLKKFFGFGALLVTSFSSSAAFECHVNVQHVLAYKDGSVNVRHSGRGDYTIICNLKQEYKGVSVTTCAIWTSMLLDVKKNNRKVYFYYDSTPSVNSCADLPIYGSAPTPVYIGE